MVEQEKAHQGNRHAPARSLYSAVLPLVCSRYLSLPDRHTRNILLGTDSDVKIRESPCEGRVEIDYALHLSKPGLERHNVVIGILVVGREGAVDLWPLLDLVVLICSATVFLWSSISASGDRPAVAAAGSKAFSGACIFVLLRFQGCWGGML